MSAPTKPTVDSPQGEREQQVVRRRPDPEAVAELLNSWANTDADEQRETYAYLRQALDEQRPSGAKLFASS